MDFPRSIPSNLSVGRRWIWPSSSGDEYNCRPHQHHMEINFHEIRERWVFALK